MAVDWAALPPELLRIIADKLTVDVADYIRFRAVCVNWRSSSPNTPPNLSCQLPWLMLPQSQPYQTSRRGFFSHATNKIHFLDLPETFLRRLCRSSHGWLVFLDESPAIFLLNPLTRAKLHLPPLTTFPDVIDFDFYHVCCEYSLRSANGGKYHYSLTDMRDSFIKKVILSHSPSINGSYMALAIVKNGNLAFCKNGDKSWRYIEDAVSFCEDIIYYNGLFYAANNFGGVTVCDVHGQSPRVSIIYTASVFDGDTRYLVSSSEELLLVTRCIEFDLDDHAIENGYTTTRFQVFRLELSGPKWEKVTSLGDKMLFLGENSSLALSSRDFPGCKGNCIYYTDDHCETFYNNMYRGHDLGIYNIEDGSIDELPCCSHNSHSPIGWPPPIWVTPYPI